MNLNSLPSPFPARDDRHYTDPIMSYHSSSMASCHDFFKDANYDFAHLEDHQSDGNYACNKGLVIKNTVESDLELSLWKKEDQELGETAAEHTNNKWMSSKMKLTEKTKNSPDHVTLKLTNQPSCDNSPIRVCSDCNTTKTPLWRSGPKGPKSLCNACGIRQRKARRAMAAAAAANGNSCAIDIGANKPPIKVHRDKTERNLGRQPYSSQIKKRCKATTAAHVIGPGVSPTNNGPHKRRFEDLLINLSKKLAIHRVFPQDEKDAAILLMALSYGLVHG